MKELIKNGTFESMLGELSAELVNLSIETIDAAIESSLKKMVDFFDADRCHLGEFLADQAKVVVPYFYSRPGINVPQTTSVGEGYLPFVYEQIRENRLLAFTKSSELPKQASHDRTVIDKMGIKRLTKFWTSYGAWLGKLQK